MKIIFFTYGIVGGGAERVLSLICNELAKRGHDITIATDHVQPVYPLLQEVKKIYFDTEGCKRFKYRIRLLKSMRHIIKSLHPDIVVGVLEFYCFYLLLASIGIRHTTTIAWDHSAFQRPHGVTMSKVVRFIKYCIYPFFDKVFVLTQKDKECAWVKSNIVVMPNPVSFLPLAVNNNIDREKIVIGVGNVGSWYVKGFDYLLEAWATICWKYPDWKLKIIGRGNSQFVRQLAEEKNIVDRVEIGSFVADVASEYKKASIFVLSSRSEGFSMVLLEAMSQGCACIACDNLGRTSEILNAEQGLIYESEDINQMASAISKYIENEELRISHGRNAILRSKDFSISKVTDMWENNLYEIK